MSIGLEALTVRLAKENPHWSYDKIQGELLKLSYNLTRLFSAQHTEAISSHAGF